MKPNTLRKRPRPDQKYPRRETLAGLPFTVRKVTDTLWVLDWKAGGCRPMTDVEIQLWAALSMVRSPRVEVLP